MMQLSDVQEARRNDNLVLNVQGTRQPVTQDVMLEHLLMHLHKVTGRLSNVILHMRSDSYQRPEDGTLETAMEDFVTKRLPDLVIEAGMLANALDQDLEARVRDRLIELALRPAAQQR